MPRNDEIPVLLDEIKGLLGEIRDNQRLSLHRHEEQLQLAREQMERSRAQIQESVELQRKAMERAKQAARIVFPLLAFLVGIVLYIFFGYL